MLIYVTSSNATLLCHMDPKIMLSSTLDSVKYVRCSQARKERFKKMKKQAGLPLKKQPSLDIVKVLSQTYCQ